MTRDKLENFLSRVMSIGASTFTILGTKRPGFTGGGLGSSGSSNNITMQLQRNVIQFATIYRDPSSDDMLIQSAANTVEGALFTEQALSTISDSELENLIDELHDLVNLHR